MNELMSLCRRTAIVAWGWAVLLALAPWCVAAEQEYALQVAKAKSIKTRYEFEIHTPKFTAKDWVLYAAQAPELPSQSGLMTTLVPEGKVYRELSDRHRTVLMARVPAKNKALQHTIKGHIECSATLYSRHLVKRQPQQSYAPVPVLTTAERETSLLESETLDFSSDEFQAWLKEHRLHKRPSESDLDLARRVFLAITGSLTYEYSHKMDRHASHLAGVESADCGGMCVLFTAAMRANGVPARMLLGRWARSSKPDGMLDGVTYRQQHILAEFYARDIGWVPVDLSSAVRHDTKEGLKYFGHDSGDFLTLHIDPDFKVDTKVFGEKSFVMLQGARYYVSGTGKLDDTTYTETWTVEKMP